jgi:hypothetical protein
MSPQRRLGTMTRGRRVGIALAGVMAAGLAAASGTALAAASSPASSASMASMQMSSSSSWKNHVGTTKGWYDGRTVTFRYTRNFRCAPPPASNAKSGCEGGASYTQTPASTFDPLYVVVPLGFTPKASTLQCKAGHCIDHPSTIDLSGILGSSYKNVLLPAHSHIVATANSHQPEWWNVIVVGVTKPSSWNAIVHARSDAELQALQRNASSGVTGNNVTNLFLFFAVR